jgi:hypothetical protein
MRKVLIVLLLPFFITGCNVGEEASALKENTNQKKIWAFLQINVPEEGKKMESYYYFGLISESLYHKISDNRIRHGFILLEDVHYWGAKDLIHQYKDNENQGNLVFRIEDIRRIKRVNNKPIVGKGTEQYDEPEDDLKKKVKDKVPPAKSKKNKLKN